VSVTSDPHAWLRPIYARLQAHPAFRQFAPSHQFDQLVQAVKREHPSKAAQMREWSVGAQHALLQHLASMVDQQATGDPEELWRVRKGERELRCVAHYLSSGIDVRLLEGDGFRRTQLCRDRPGVEKLSEDWLKALVERGWELSD
jgi:hypothetical protein